MNAKKLLLLASLGVTVLGCQDLPQLSDDNQVLPAQSSSGLVVRPDSPIVDVPMPVGFVVVESQSRSHALTGVGRYIEHYYQGRAPKGDTVNFYREELPKHQWVLKQQHESQGTYVLDYSKGREELRVRVNNPRDVTTVMVLIRTPTATGERPTVP